MRVLDPWFAKEEILEMVRTYRWRRHGITAGIDDYAQRVKVGTSLGKRRKSCYWWQALGTTRYNIASGSFILFAKGRADAIFSMSSSDIMQEGNPTRSTNSSWLSPSEGYSTSIKESIISEDLNLFLMARMRQKMFRVCKDRKWCPICLKYALFVLRKETALTL